MSEEIQKQIFLKRWLWDEFESTCDTPEQCSKYQIPSSCHGCKWDADASLAQANIALRRLQAGGITPECREWEDLLAEWEAYRDAHQNRVNSLMENAQSRSEHGTRQLLRSLGEIDYAWGVIHRLTRQIEEETGKDYLNKIK